MPRNLLLSVLTIAILGGAYVYAVQADAADNAKAAEEPQSYFGDNLVLIYFKGRSADFAFTLSDVKFIELNGQKLLSGVHADTGDASDWMRNRRAHVAWDAVESLTLFDTVDQYKQALEDASDASL
jgi:hypothetical protein